MAMSGDEKPAFAVNAEIVWQKGHGDCFLELQSIGDHVPGV